MEIDKGKKQLCFSLFRPAALLLSGITAVFLMSLPVMRAFSAEAKKDEPKRWRYELMRPADLDEAIKTRPIAWLVVSPLEWHGEALALGCDPITGQAIVDRAWEKVGGVRIPTLHIGVEIDYKAWEGNRRNSYWGMENVTREHNPGSIFVNTVTLELVMRDYLYFLEREGFKLVVVVSGHGTGDHLNIIGDACEKYSKGPMKAILWRRSSSGTPEELRFTGAAGHADFNEASVLGGVDPTLVDKSKFGVIGRDRKASLLKENASKIDFEKGRKIIDFSALQLENDVKELIRSMNL